MVLKFELREIKHTTAVQCTYVHSTIQVKYSKPKGYMIREYYSIFESEIVLDLSSDINFKTEVVQLFLYSALFETFTSIRCIKHSCSKDRNKTSHNKPSKGFCLG